MKTLVAALIALLIFQAQAFADEPLKALRVWPSPDYTRITFESHTAIEYEISVIPEPSRVVLDLQNVEFDSVHTLFAAKSFDHDPYVRAARVGRFKPGVTRLVLDLRADVRPQIFALKPVAQYEHRLVLDLYPLTPPDPLAELINRDRADPIAELAAAASAAASTTAPSASASAGAASPAATAAPASAVTAASSAKGSAAAASTLPAAPGEMGPPAPAAAQTKTPGEQKRIGAVAVAEAQTRGALTTPNLGHSGIARTRGGLPRTVIVVIDAGHGGEDPGARGHRGTYEKDVTLAIAKRLKAVVDQQPQMRAILTRDSDYFIPLAGRVDKARRAQADLFVSIHADSFVRPNARGSSVFVLSERGASSTAASWLARQENKADLIGGVNLDMRDRHVAQTLLDLSQTAQISDSLTLGQQVLTELGGVNRLHKSFVEQAGFAVLKSPDVPSILVETAFISNPEEEKRLRDPAYQQKIALAILGGLKRYFARNPPLARQIVASQAR